MLPVVARRASGASALFLALLLVSCGDTDGGDGARPTISPTATLPSPELPSPTRSPDRTGRPDLPTPTRSPDRPESPSEPAQPSSQPPEPEPASETPTPTAAETDEPADTPAEESVEEWTDAEGVPTWVWWLVAALVVGSLVAIPLMLRARRRSAWRQELAEAEGEVAWFARELLPRLRQAASRELVVGGWAVVQARVAAAEDRLTVLEPTAPDEAGRQRARSLRDAVRQARVDMEQLTGPESRGMWALDLDAIIADLEVALRPSQGSSPS